MKALFLVLFVLLGLTSNALADRVLLLSDDKEALQARVDIVQQAKSEILAEYFSVWNDDQSVGGFALLLDAARRGVKVKVIIDAMSNSVPRSVFNAMMENGKDAQGNQNIEIKLYNPLSINLFKATHRDHSKMLIVDGKRLIIGGRNIGDKYFGLNKKRNFSDLDVLLDGSAVTSAREDFLAVFESDIVKNASYARNRPTLLLEKNCHPGPHDKYNRCNSRKNELLNSYYVSTNRIQKTLEDILKATPQDVVNSNTNKDWLADVQSGAKIEFLSHQPDKIVSEDTNDLSDALLALAGTTKKDLNILSPYLIPTMNTYTLLDALLKKNIKIRVVTNSLRSTDNLFAQAGYLASKKKLIEMGIELYEYNGPDTAHGKAVVIDGTVAFVGTFNLDPRSSFLNREVGVFVKSTSGNRFANVLTQEIERFRENSLLVGKDGIEQNVEEQKRLTEELSKTKKAALALIKLFVPLFRSQI